MKKSKKINKSNVEDEYKRITGIYDKQNEAPTLGEFLEFMKLHPEFKAHGYIVSNDRDDRRITIEGLEGTAKDELSLTEFKNLCEYADEFRCENGNCFSWWD